jgi:hypothetical protein
VTLDRLRTLDEIPEGEAIPEAWVHDGLQRERFPGITQAGIVALWDERRNNETAWSLRGGPRCPRCTHRSRLKRIYHKDAFRCRWGHEVWGGEVLGR